MSRVTITAGLGFDNARQCLALGVNPCRLRGAGQLAQLVKALGALPKGPGFEPDLAPTHIASLQAPQGSDIPATVTVNLNMDVGCSRSPQASESG